MIASVLGTAVFRGSEGRQVALLNLSVALGGLAQLSLLWSKDNPLGRWDLLWGEIALIFMASYFLIATLCYLIVVSPAFGYAARVWRERHG